MVELTTLAIFIIAIIAVFIAFYIGSKVGASKKHREWELALPGYRKDAIMKSRSVLGGHFTENLAPYLPDFPYKPNECTFVGKPIDFLVFKGSDEKKIDEVVFVEVKSGNARLSPQEKNLKEAIDKGNVRFEEYRIPKELTEKGDIEDRIGEVVNGEE
jgi:predicted Holliday junction resolvase-like endonuclease